MKIETRFRGIDINTDKWVYGYYAKHQHKDIIVNDVFVDNGYDFVFNFINPDSLGEFTGLTDKNGIDIYEGDLLEFKNELGRHNLHKVFRVTGGLVINSHKDDFYKDYTPFWEACADMQTMGWIKQCEVIGNITKNPEFLVDLTAVI